MLSDRENLALREVNPINTLYEANIPTLATAKLVVHFIILLIKCASLMVFYILNNQQVISIYLRHITKGNGTHITVPPGEGKLTICWASQVLPGRYGRPQC